MDRRKFMKNAAVAAAGTVAGMNLIETPAVWSKDTGPTELIERRTLGRTGDRLSVIGFGGIIVMNQTPEEASHYVASAVDRGINYFDVAPSYGNAEERLGPALAPHRSKVFLACKTAQREGDAALKELENSLKLMHTDHFDLYQLHAITKVDEDVTHVFKPGGVMDQILKAKAAGKIRHIGFSAHSEAAANAAMDQYDFDTILFPLNFSSWEKGHFGPKTIARVRERNMGVLALKAMALQKWPENSKPETRKWQKAWYQPLDNVEQVELALRYTLHLPVTSMLPPGHWELFDMAVKLAAGGRLKAPLNSDEQNQLKQLAAPGQPIF